MLALFMACRYTCLHRCVLFAAERVGVLLSVLICIYLFFAVANTSVYGCRMVR